MEQMCDSENQNNSNPANGCFPKRKEQKIQHLFRKQYFIYCKVPETVNILSEVQWTGSVSLKRWTVFQEQHLKYSREILTNGVMWCKAHLPSIPCEHHQ